MDIICVLMKCDSKHENNNSWHFMDIICILMKYYFHAYDRNSCISKYCICILINETLFSCLRS